MCPVCPLACSPFEGARRGWGKKPSVAKINRFSIVMGVWVQTGAVTGPSESVLALSNRSQTFGKQFNRYQ